MAVHPKGEAIMSPGGLVKDPISALSLGLGLMFGTAGLPHILMHQDMWQACGTKHQTQTE